MRTVSGVLGTMCIVAAVGCAAETAPDAPATPVSVLVPNVAQAGAAAAPAMLDPIAACIASHPPSDPFDVGFVPAQRAGTMAPALPPPLVLITDACRQDGGTACEPASFMSKQAAECVAALHGFPQGVGTWNTSLSYFSAPKRVVWSVMYSVLDPSGGSASGRRIVIDAIDGQLLDEAAFSVVP